ncbi:unnamed protein product [Kluyveromyces dobzhanskii CBS 2104]|uniref:WGS project CCBQ000000000 data, contig 00015 n=1 Tax=Kluyveromyces dobzhanskii CBS 2104 TaxID=1427455 RepID=A0A0A8L9I1_9SACH|nr:unnamed protein product [Kluyveromyces dobzhanskii CBS 2104]
MPLHRQKFENGLKFQFPPPIDNSESPCKSHSEMMKSQELLASYTDPRTNFQDNQVSSCHISIPLLCNQFGCTAEDDFNFVDELDDEFESCEDDSVVSSILSSLSENDTPTPSSSPVLDVPFCKGFPKSIHTKTGDHPATVAMFKLSLPTKTKFKPNKDLKPNKSILKKSEGLNFIMNSLNGNYKDATIFATEVNSYLTENVPYPTCPIERVTIPVNSEIKKKYKHDRNESLGGYYNPSDEEEDLSADDEIDEDNKHIETETAIKQHTDAAVIRAYNFKFEKSAEDTNTDATHLGIYSQIQLTNVQETVPSDKKVRWCEFLEW